jgi:RHS repeat-associated protein
MGRGRIGLAVTAAGLWLAGGVAHAQSSASDYTYATRYDAERRVVATIAPDPDGAGPLNYAAVRNTYDTTGRLTRVETGELSSWQPESVDPAAWTSPTFTVYHQADTEYDTMDRKTVVRVSAGGTTYAVTQFSYDGFGRLECTAVRMNPSTWSALPPSACTPGTPGSDGPDRITRNIYDSAGQLLQVRKAVGTPVESADATYSYTTNGKQQDMVDARGGHARFVYDGFDRQTQWIFPSPTAASAFNDSTPASALATANALNTADYEQYGYDANGNRTSFRRRDGRVFTLAYDALNRLSSRALTTTACTLTCTAISSSQRRGVYFAYDLQGHQLSARFDSTAGADGVISDYTGFGELKRATTAMGGTSRTFDYAYDPDGNRIRITHPDTSYFQYAYDGLDRAKSISENGGTAIASFAYDAQAHPTAETRGAVDSSYGYDGLERLSLLTDNLHLTAADVTTTYAYNPASQLKSEVRSNDSYAFTGSVNVARSYTANGLNQYSAAGAATFGYDANGNLTSDGTTSYTYDAENRLLGTSAGAVLTYDPNGRLWQVSSGSTTTQFLYDGDQLSAEYNGSGTLLRRYVHGTGVDDPLIWYEGSGLTARRSLQVNRQGSIVSIADANGDRVAVDSYDEYGIPGASNAGRFQYTGQAWLPELGMYYYKARIYSPTLGRFLQTDPIGYADQVNLYAYVGDDPVGRADSTGTQQTWEEPAPEEEVNEETGRYRVTARGPELPAGTRYRMPTIVRNPGSPPLTYHETARVLEETDTICIPDSNSLSSRASSTQGRGSGSYTNFYESGRTYSGKGSIARSQTSGRRVEREYGDRHVATEWTSSPNGREGFKDESRRLDFYGGPSSLLNYNRINSPGATYRRHDKEP